MDFIKEVLKDKSLRKLTYTLLFFVGFLFFPKLWNYLIIFIVIAILFDSFITIIFKSNNSNKDTKKDISDSQYYTQKANKLRDAWQVMLPKTFYEVIGQLGNDTWIFYSKQLYNSKKITTENKWLIDEFQRAQENCDQFFDGKEYIKFWTIFRSLERKGVSEEEFNNAFPHLKNKIERIRDKDWEEIGWTWALVHEIDRINEKEDSCTKELLQKSLKYYDQNVKKKFLDNLTEEQKNEYRLLTVLDLEKEKQKDKENLEEVFKSLPDTSKLGRVKPKKINSVITWKLEDAIKFGEEVWNVHAVLEVPDLNGLGIDESKALKNKLKFAGTLESDEIFTKFLGKEISSRIKDIDRVRDFYKFEMYDPDPISSFIKHKDIERIIFHALIELPKKTLIYVESNDQVHIQDPQMRAPYFAIMKCQMGIILQVMRRLGIYDDEEEIIKIWIMNQITDPLDKEYFCDTILKEANKDKKYFKKIWKSLYTLLLIKFLDPKGLVGSVDDVISIIDNIFFDTLQTYFLRDRELAFSSINIVDDAINDIDENSEWFLGLID